MFEADDGGHRALAGRNRGLHGIAADAQKARGVGDREHAGGAERRIFAERMTGDEGNLVLQHETAGFHDADRGHGDGHQSRLGVCGQREGLFRAVPHDLGELFAERVIDFLEDCTGLGKGVGEILAHADGLAALTRKGECECHGCFPEFLVFWLLHSHSWLSSQVLRVFSPGIRYPVCAVSGLFQARQANVRAGRPGRLKL